MSSAVLSGQNPGDPMHLNQDIDQFILAAGIETAPVTVELARAALTARIRWGKSCSSPPGLNFGDCFAYALAKSNAAPLLFVRNDFPKTDPGSGLSQLKCFTAQKKGPAGAGPFHVFSRDGASLAKAGALRGERRRLLRHRQVLQGGPS